MSGKVTQSLNQLRSLEELDWHCKSLTKLDKLKNRFVLGKFRGDFLRWERGLQHSFDTISLSRAIVATAVVVLVVHARSLSGSDVIAFWIRVELISHQSRMSQSCYCILEPRDEYNVYYVNHSRRNVGL